jgi:hypothetical protein
MAELQKHLDEKTNNLKEVIDNYERMEKEFTEVVKSGLTLLA